MVKTHLNQQILVNSDQAYQITLEPNDSQQLALLCGPFDAHLRQIEKRLSIIIKNRGNHFQLLGDKTLVHIAGKLLNHLYGEVINGTHLSANILHLFLQESNIETLCHRHLDPSRNPKGVQKLLTDQDDLIITRRKSIQPRGGNQLAYVEAIRNHDINFGIGPAGTGKTYLGVATAVEALEQERVRRILLVRPAVEAGEKLGFLPGDLAQKINPYLRPLYDALYAMLGFERVVKLIEKNVIEVAPLAYMRGRTLNDSFIILDESQNTTAEQMKMFLTRVGFGSTVVVTGDITQVDLPQGTRSGLHHVVTVLAHVKGISFTQFTPKDVVRHPLVQQIVEAYAKHEVPQHQDD